MTLDEAITHAREVAEKNYLQGMLCHANPNDEELDGCIECGREHEQLAEWLEELKAYREIGTVEECRNSVLNILKAYNKAIDDFVKEYKSCDNRSIQCKKFLNCADCVAAQLKAGGRE